LQVAVPDRGDHTTFHLLYCCQTEQDFLLKTELDALAGLTGAAGGLQITYILSSPVAAWPIEHIGRIDQDKVLAWGGAHLEAAKKQAGVVGLVCGPDGFCTAATDILGGAGISPQSIHVF
jgi:NAD(P)H-flavin reductase